MSFFRRRAKGKELERPADTKATRAPVSSQSPSLGSRNHHAIQDAAGPSHVAISAISANMDSFARGRTAILKKQPSHMEAAHFGDLGRSSVNSSAQETRSRLSKTVEQIVRDAVATPYYLQFMEAQGADHLVRFWLEAESFRATSWSRLQATNALKQLSDKLMKKSVRNDIVAKICGEDGQVDPNCFVTAQLVVFSIMEQQHFTQFLRSHHFCKYQIEVLTSGSVFLADILFCESALFYFSEYMEKEEAVNILQFWLAADNFQDQLAAKKGQYDGQEAQNDAMILYDKYFSLQATNPLGFDDAVRLEIESNICREGGPLPDCFTTPLRQAWTTMEKVYMPGFLSSNLYYKYLNDLIYSVRADEFFGGNAIPPGQGVPQDGERGASTSEEMQAQQGAKKAAIKILKTLTRQ
ncbi:hypothetical protein AAFF_G00272700 [Aldrovandia affinis]|uniref:RGS domain-containing protein n=1 Tax=Aldrovandia affinis TaxID=143900 RepID=A0AAD7W1G9_9TELE|nr:hypothetical protein AAFF_G00272700 [Aldrovandia affinis]